jgi:hypothetical protein
MAAWGRPDAGNSAGGGRVFGLQAIDVSERAVFLIEALYGREAVLGRIEDAKGRCHGWLATRT